MAAFLIYTFDRIAPAETTSLFVHDYSDKDASAYCVVPYNVFEPDNPFPQAHVTLTQGETFRWAVNGTVGRKIYIQNHQAHPVRVDLLEIRETRT